MKTVKLVIALLILGVLLSGCTLLDKYRERKTEKQKDEVLKYLENRYDEKFGFNERIDMPWEGRTFLDCYSLELDTGYFRVSPNWTEIGFSDGYYHARKDYYMEKYYKPKLDDIFDRDLRFTVNYGVDNDDINTQYYIDIGSVNDIDKMLKKYVQDLDIVFYIHIFKEDMVKTEAKKMGFVKKVDKFIKYLKNQGVPSANIYIYIFDEEFFSDKDIDGVLRETSWFHRASMDLGMNGVDLRRKRKYGMWISTLEYKRGLTVEELRGKFIYHENYYKK